MIYKYYNTPILIISASSIFSNHDLTVPYFKPRGHFVVITKGKKNPTIIFFYIILSFAKNRNGIVRTRGVLAWHDCLSV